MSARSWPAALGATFWLFLYRLGAALIVSQPLARILGASGPDASPDGDLALFAPGALELVESLRTSGVVLLGAAEGAALAASLLAAGGLVPLAFALASLAAPGDRPSVRASRALAAFPRLFLCSGAVLLCQVALGVVAMMLSTRAWNASGSFDDERGATLLSGLALLPFAGAALLLGVLHDVARALVVRDGATARSAFTGALAVLAARPLTTVLAGLLPTLAGLSLVAGVAWLTALVDVSRPGAHRVALVFALHQATVLALCGLRVAWLGAALRLLPGAAPEEPACTPEHTGVPGDPRTDPAA